MSNLLSLLIRWGLGLGVGLGLAFYAGVQHQQRKEAEADKKELIAAQQRYQEEQQRGLEAAGSYLNEHADQETRYEELDQKYQRLLRQGVPLLVAAPADQPQAGGGKAEQQTGAAPLCINVFMRPQLSLAAVWMWNSALEGRDAPAGTCGAADATPEACSAAAGVTAADAIANHAINAKTCADDRLRFNRLLDYLDERERNALKN
jgi:hypothetical protein